MILVQLQESLPKLSHIQIFIPITNQQVEEIETVLNVNFRVLEEASLRHFSTNNDEAINICCDRGRQQLCNPVDEANVVSVFDLFHGVGAFLLHLLGARPLPIRQQAHKIHRCYRKSTVLALGERAERIFGKSNFKSSSELNRTNKKQTNKKQKHQNKNKK